MTDATLMTPATETAAPATPATAAAPQPDMFDAATGAPIAPSADGKAAEPAEGEKKEGETQTPEQIAEAEAAAKAALGAPEKYDDFNAPENAQLDTEVMTEFANVAKELNLPQDKAQLLIDKMQPIIAARQAAQVETLRTTWGEQSRADTEFGGANLDANMVHAARAMNTFATPAFKEVLNASGLGNHPELVRFMVKAGKAISEEKVITGGIPASGSSIRSAADVLYPTPGVKK